ncbi:nuclear transport factor 2 family protein [Bacterioplanoides sp.]|uniref:nuclear transport factor 2 family protein n=1 Tax=Bacterioplanoides sp. TaxID=2066072 RepID=UPI003B58E2CE
MTSYTDLKKIFIAFSMLAISQFTGALDMSQTKIATAYYKALYSGDHDLVQKVASPDMVFEDPSAPAEFEIPPVINNLEDFLSFMKANLQGEVMVTIKDSFVSNDRVILMVEVKGMLPASSVGLKGSMVRYETSGVTVLHVVNGKVIRHTDFMDYPGLTKSFKPINQ